VFKHWFGRAHSEFLLARQQGQPFARPGIRAACELFDWPKLEEVLQSRPAPDVIVVRRGQLLDEPAPRSEQDVRQLFQQGAGVVVRHAHRNARSLRVLTEAVAAELAATVHVQLFVTPAGTHGFGWHYDPDDVTIVQTVGEKDFYFRANTQHPQLEVGARPDFRVIERETSPLLSCRLLAGDALYLPRGTWHVAYARQDALSLSIGAR
jgi:50S ribosomal protein L16 3-hydroxylase